MYAGLFLTEGIGLWLAKRWAEWFTAIITGSLIPFELYETLHRPTAIRILVLLLNLAVLAYLIRRIMRKSDSRSSRRTIDGERKHSAAERSTVVTQPERLHGNSFHCFGCDLSQKGHRVGCQSFLCCCCDLLCDELDGFQTDRCLTLEPRCPESVIASPDGSPQIRK